MIEFNTETELLLAAAIIIAAITIAVITRHNAKKKTAQLALKTMHVENLKADLNISRSELREKLHRIADSDDALDAMLRSLYGERYRKEQGLPGLSGKQKEKENKNV